ncbi:hypothetical protein BH23GEM3_BH23GEM3_10040 [soil metagenome]
MNVSRPYLSVVVPAHQAAGVLPLSLAGLRDSELPRQCWELIVVDDASEDDTSLVAAEYADAVIRLPCKPRGPAYTRNRGCEASQGEILVFVDSDVVVHAETLSQFAALFAADPDLAAAFGSYDSRPTGSGVVSQYRNLMHHYVHQRGGGEAETFWAGCGAVRREVFMAVGMFDEWHYPRPQIEDLELGRRMCRSGHRILLCPEIQGTYLKRWTIGNMLATDLKDRGVPWMQLLLQEGAAAASATLNVRATDRWCTALIGAALLSVAAAIALWMTPPLLVAVGAPAVVVFLNRAFYAFLRRERGVLFAAAAIPLHLLYYVLNGVSVIVGSLVYTLFGGPLPSDDASAQEAIGIRTWPPGPRPPASGFWNPPDHGKGRGAHRP